MNNNELSIEVRKVIPISRFDVYISGKRAEPFFFWKGLW